jgi:hypothetical protein
MSGSIGFRLSKLARFRILKERIAFRERVQARGIADKSMMEVAAQQSRLADHVMLADKHNKKEFDALLAQRDVSAQSVIAAYDNAALRDQNIREMHSNLIQAEDSAKLHMAEFERLAAIHNRIRKRVNGLEELVRELQVEAKRHQDLLQDEAAELEMLGTSKTILAGETAGNEHADPTIKRGSTHPKSSITRRG